MGAAQAARPRKDNAGVRVSPLMADATLSRILVHLSESKPTPTSVCPLGLGNLPATRRHPSCLTRLEQKISLVGEWGQLARREMLAKVLMVWWAQRAEPRG